MAWYSVKHRDCISLLLHLQDVVSFLIWLLCSVAVFISSVKVMYKLINCTFQYFFNKIYFSYQ